MLLVYVTVMTRELMLPESIVPEPLKSEPTKDHSYPDAFTGSTGAIYLYLLAPQTFDVMGCITIEAGTGLVVGLVKATKMLSVELQSPLLTVQ